MHVCWHTYLVPALCLFTTDVMHVKCHILLAKSHHHIGCKMVIGTRDVACPICHSGIPFYRLSVGLSVCLVYCGKTADWIWMMFGMVGWLGPRMWQVVGVGDWPMALAMGSFGGGCVCGNWVCNQATEYASQHTWCLSQARINWEGCGRKGIWHKNGRDDGGRGTD